MDRIDIQKSHVGVILIDKVTRHGTRYDLTKDTVVHNSACPVSSTTGTDNAGD
jgi:hypothetical protein